jgi:spore coat protein U-like protein
MKFEKKHLAAGIAAACSYMGASHAAGTQVITVSATVASTCKVQSGVNSIALAVDPSLTTVVSNTGTVLYRCSNGLTPTITLTSANTGVLKGPSPATTESFAYASSNSAPVAGAGFGTDRTLTVTVAVTQSAAAAVSAGTYTDSLTVSINP